MDCSQFCDLCAMSYLLTAFNMTWPQSSIEQVFGALSQLLGWLLLVRVFCTNVDPCVGLCRWSVFKWLTLAWPLNISTKIFHLGLLSINTIGMETKTCHTCNDTDLGGAQGSKVLASVFNSKLSDLILFKWSWKFPRIILQVNLPL